MYGRPRAYKSSYKTGKADLDHHIIYMSVEEKAVKHFVTAKCEEMMRSLKFF